MKRQTIIILITPGKEPQAKNQRPRAILKSSARPKAGNIILYQN